MSENVLFPVAMEDCMVLVSIGQSLGVTIILLGFYDYSPD